LPRFISAATSIPAAWRNTDYGRKPVAWLPEVEAPAGSSTPVVQVADEHSGEVVYTLRALEIPGKYVMDVRRVTLTLCD
jgi:hypothetical protein